MSRVYFRVNAGKQIGLGHLMRCQALAQALAQALDEQGVDCLFLVNPEAEPFCRSRHDWVGRIQIIPTDLEIQQEPAWIAAFLNARSTEALVLDGYQFSADYRAALKQNHIPLVLFDDNNDSGPLHGDMVINGASNAAALQYDLTAPQAELCLGAEYRILRQEFIVKPEVSWSKRNSLTLVFGGSDVLGLTLNILRELDKRQVTFPVRVMTGAAYSQHQQLNSLIHQSHLAIQHLADCQQVADIFCHSRLVVSAAGGTQFELLACHTPSVLIAVAENQLNATEQAAGQGWCEWKNFTVEQNITGLVDRLCELWGDEKRLSEMHQKTRLYADLDGANRVIERLSRLKVNKR